MEKEPITVSGLQNLKTELEDLKNNQRPKIVEAIAEARSHGDLKENAEYHAAKEQQSLLEQKIAEIEATLANCQIIDVKEIPHTGRVVFGSTVEVYDASNDAEISYQIVGNLESDPANGKISIDTPIAKSLIGKSEGDEVAVETPSGKISLQIVLVKHN